MSTNPALRNENDDRSYLKYVLFGLEAEARAMLDAARHQRKHDPAEHVIYAIFTLEWSSALPLTRIEKYAAAISFFEMASKDLERALSRLVRAGLLRSRMSDGTRLYELNY